nr:MAG TPA: chitin synthase regulator [Caudoviricetes sp.]
MTGIVGLIWLTGAAVVGLVLGLVVVAVEEIRKRRNGQA